MELDEQSFLEELLALRRDALDSPSSDHLLFSCFIDDPHICLHPPPLPVQPPLPFATTTQYSSHLPSSICTNIPFPPPDTLFRTDLTAAPPPLPDHLGVCKVDEEPPQQPHQGSSASSTCERKPSRLRKAEGQPSKNLMAERRRRKRLNDRLSMLRSVVPKISKMDRTSILGDTIDYMKELLERIKLVQGEMELDGRKQGQRGNLQGGGGILVKDCVVGPNEILVRNTPQFEVERRELDTRIGICCAGKPGLLLSTVNTLEALGLEIQQCVVSCFNDFGMQASCSEDPEQRGVISVDDIKQALFRNAGYGGRCI